MRASLIVACVLFSLSLPAKSAEILISSKIDAVTVFSKGAEVVRLATVQLEPGDHSLILRDLPAHIADNSVRVMTEVEGEMKIRSVDSRHIFLGWDEVGASGSPRHKLEDEIERLGDEKARLGDLIQAREAQKTLIISLTKLPANRPSRGGSPLASDTDWAGLYDFIGARMDLVLSKIQKTTLEQRALSRKIKTLKKKLSELPATRHQRTEVKIHVTAAGPLRGSLKILYKVQKAWWRPFYDGILETGDGEKEANLTLIRRAEVRQNSGEKWQNIVLSLSTVRPEKGTSSPKLKPQKIVVLPREPVPEPMAYSEESADRLGELKSEQFDAAPGAALRQGSPFRRRAEEVATPVLQSNFQALFSVPGRVSIAAKNQAKKVYIESLKLQAELKVRAVPKLTPTAYLYAKFKFSGKTPLLPGAIALTRDHNFIGNGRIPLLNAGAEHQLGFGVDNAIKVRRHKVRRSEGETGLISSSKTDERHFRISVKNLHDWEMPVTIIDQLPFAENEKIEVTRLSKTTKPSRENIDKKRGLLAWDYDLKAGEERTIELSYRIRWPDDMEIIVPQ